MIPEKFTVTLEAGDLLALLEYEYSSVEAIIDDILSQVKPDRVTREEFVEALTKRVQELWEQEEMGVIE